MQQRIAQAHSDRFLPGLRPEAPRVGTAFSCQLQETLPADAHDVPMTALLTETRLVKVPLHA